MEPEPEFTELDGSQQTGDPHATEIVALIEDARDSSDDATGVLIREVLGDLLDHILWSRRGFQLIAARQEALEGEAQNAVFKLQGIAQANERADERVKRCLAMVAQACNVLHERV